MSSATNRTTPFDLAGPLPAEGQRMLLEASAGTGKTYAIVTLAVRYLAEGRATLPGLLLITFTREATRELRSRLRERLTETAASITNNEPAGADPILQALDAASQRPEALERIQAALAEYDRATIATTHEFCATMLTELGMLADHDTSELLADDQDTFVHEIAVDCWLRRFSQLPEISLPLTSRKWAAVTAESIARKVTSNSGAQLWPEPDHPELTQSQREQVEFAHDVRAEFERRKRSMRVQTFDDLQDRLRDALANPTTGPLVARRLQERFPLVMVDEFQDTDPVQWQVLREAFDGQSTMVLIGDPKQAIYAFRGADVHSYLEARGGADVIHSLDCNWRTDEPVQHALDALFHEATLGDGIPVSPVRSANPGRLFTGSGAPVAPMRVDIIAKRFTDVSVAHRQVAEHVADRIVEVLQNPPLLTIKDESRAVTAGDLAVLVRTGRMGEAVRDALGRRDVPVVFPGARGVFSSPAAEHWETLLQAIDQPWINNIRSLALTPLIGWSLLELSTADDDAVAELTHQVRQWSHVLTADGVAALFDAVGADRDVPRRLLATDGGERMMTDLRHLTQALHRAQRSSDLTSSGLLSWLRNRRLMADDRDEEPRRLETDSDVVYITTSHGAKGLEFPLVFLPDTWDRMLSADPLPVYHERSGQGSRRLLDVSGPSGQASHDHQELARAEQFDEDLRLFYVAATRARHHLTLWWANMANRTEHSPLQRLLFGSLAAGITPPTHVPEPSEPLPAGMPHLLQAGAEVHLVRAVDGQHLSQSTAHDDSTLATRTFARGIDRRWRRTSYSGLTAEAHALAPNVSSEPPVSGTEDEPPVDEAIGLAVDSEGSMVSPMAGLPTGAGFGTLVHEIFEQVDFRAADLAGEVATQSSRLLARMPVPGLNGTALAEALVPSLLTPLGPLAGQQRLADVAAGDRLPELDFDYPLAGGNSPRGTATLGDIAALLTDGLAADDPLVEYPAMLNDPVLADEALRGFLTGSIDAVLRFRADGQPRYLVVDYKTNWLGPLGTELLVDHYHPEAMAQAMMRSHYPLQALLYQVALHRFLRWRQPGYQPERHLGGVLYLFVRGMAGPDTPITAGVPHGVFSWRPPARVVTDLSDLIATGGTR